MRGVVVSAFSDLGAGLRRHRLWLALAREDIGDQHRRTTLGPLWMLINYLAFAATFIFVFNGAAATQAYPAYVATGLLVWFFIMETVSQSVSLFVREESFIKGTTLPLSVHVLRLCAQSTIRGGYTLLGCLAILLLSAAPVYLGWAWAVLGLALILAVAPAAIIVFAFLGAYVPDSQFVVANLMRLGMFLTPVFWLPGAEHSLQRAFYTWNPFTYFLEIVRQPVLTGQLPLAPLALCLAISIVLWSAALLLLGSYRRHVVFAL
jgi:lipopolysaccharide transport system permease protein